MRLSEMTNGKLINLARKNNKSAIKELNKRGVYFDRGRMYDSKSLLDTNDEKRVITYYANDMKVKIKKRINHYLLQDNNLSTLCERLVKDYVSDYKKNNNDNMLAEYIQRRITNFIQRTDEEKLYKYYISKVCINNNLKRYFYDKYFSIFEKFGIKDENIYITNLFEILSMENIVSINIEANLEKKFKEYKRMQVKLHKEKYQNEIEKLNNNEEFDMDFLYEYNYYLVDRIYKKYKDPYKKEDKDLFDFCTFKYDDYFYRYIDLIKKGENIDSELRVYLQNCLTYSVKSHKLPISITEDIKREKEENRENAIYLIYKVMMENLKQNDYLNMRVYEELLKEFEISSNLYYEKKISFSFEEFVEDRLTKKIKGLKR